MPAKRPIFFDACAGIGGFHHGMKATGFSCVGAAEIDSRLQEQYPSAFSLDPARMFGDLHGLTRTKKWKAVRKDMMGCVLTAGFPCQPFSKSGPQLGKEHAEGTVFGALVEILTNLKCRGFIFENVENLTGKRHKKTFEEMKEVLKNEGYDIAYSKYSPDQVGIPQHRQRWFILGRKRSDRKAGVEHESILSDMNAAVYAPPTPHLQQNLIHDILSTKALRTGSPITEPEREALLLWDQYLGWLVENEELDMPTTLWGMEAQDAYNFDSIQRALDERKSRGITRSQLIDALKGHRKTQAEKQKLTKGAIITTYLPPYLKDLAKRKNRYPDWKERHITRSRNQMLSVRNWLRAEGRGEEWKDWYKRLIGSIISYQKFEWNVKNRPSRTTNRDDTKRLKTRFKKYLIQFRGSGVRVARGDRHPALVAIGQIPIVGRSLRRPRWQTLAKLQSMPEDFVEANPSLFGTKSKPIKCLGNAVNVLLVQILAGVLLSHITPFSK